MVAAAAVAVAVVFWLRNRDLAARLRRTAPYLIAGGAPAPVVGHLTGLLGWDVIDQGGDLGDGVIGGIGHCPCQHEYTVATTMVPLAAKPNAAQIPGLLAYPLAAAAEWKCPEDCIQVMTHTWQCWLLETDGATWQLACSTLAQYHCKKPDDPD